MIINFQDVKIIQKKFEELESGDSFVFSLDDLIKKQLFMKISIFDGHSFEMTFNRAVNLRNGEYMHVNNGQLIYIVDSEIDVRII